MAAAEKHEYQLLIAGCLEGNRASQQQVYERFYGKMMGLCLRYAKNAEEAKDILQEGFIKVFANIGKYDNKGSFEGWIRRIVVNTAIDHFRKEKYQFVNVDDDYMDHLQEKGSLGDDDEPVGPIIETKRVLEEVQKLSPAYRTVFNLYVLEGLSHKEISDSLGISVGTSKSNLAKAKMNLKKAFKKVLNYQNG